MENHPRNPYNHNTIWLWSWLSNWMNYMSCLGRLIGGFWVIDIWGAGEGSFVFWGTAESKGPVRTYSDSLEKPRSIPMQSHLGSVVLCLASTLHGWVQSSSELLRELWLKCTTSAELKLIYQPCSRSRAAWTLTWLINLKMDINHILVISCGLAEYQP